VGIGPRHVARILAGFGILVLVVIVGSAVWVARRHSSGNGLRQAAGIVPGVLLHARNFHWTQMKGERQQWTLNAAEAGYTQDQTSLDLKGAELSMTTEDGKAVKVVAPQARLKLSGNHITGADLGGGLRVTYGEFMLATEKATFMPEGDLLSAPGAVTIEGEGGLKVTGMGLRGHFKAQNFVIESDVNTLVTPKARNGKSGKR
jgi:LPS export ABC transporter protein LptC